MGQWQNSEWAREMGNIVTDISGKYDLQCFPFSLANGILQLIRVLNFNEVQCISLLCVCQLRKLWWKKESFVYFKVMWLYLILSWPLSYKVLQALVFTEEEIETETLNACSRPDSEVQVLVSLPDSLRTLTLRVNPCSSWTHSDQAWHSWGHLTADSPSGNLFAYLYLPLEQMQILSSS